MKRHLFAVPAAALLLVLAMPLLAQDQPKPADAKGAAAAEKPPEPAKFLRQHKMKIGAADFAYTTTSEEIFLKDGDGKNTATFFTIAYTKDGVAHPEDRPITFVFNGGPGSASVWLHFGLVGPKVIDIPSDAADPGGPPYKLRDNGSTILRATDLVFVDPVGTGYSHAPWATRRTRISGATTRTPTRSRSSSARSSPRTIAGTCRSTSSARATAASARRCSCRACRATSTSASTASS
ncbi:MAG TPA: hypothetical protein VEO74_17575 [Thermoanaerobaculia bacterium]|nr:hypothetical protein [Thermoanaerobaculia bacterium]